MAYTLPQFNLDVSYTHYLAGGGRSVRFYVKAQLKGMPRPAALAGLNGAFQNSALFILKLPKLTDVRSGSSQSNSDWFYLPGWQGNPLFVTAVYDVATGFPNEYRCAVLALTNAGASGTYSRLPGQGLTPP